MTEFTDWQTIPFWIVRILLIVKIIANLIKNIRESDCFFHYQKDDIPERINIEQGQHGQKDSTDGIGSSNQIV